MGSLPPLPEKTAANGLIDEETLAKLFKAQQDHLNYFFTHFDISQALTFFHTLLSTAGTIFFSGVGKSGFVALKISTTLVSIGVPSAFLSPLDALHGDIGILSSRDVLVLLSKLGASEELLNLIPFASGKGDMLVSVTSRRGSALDRSCDQNVYLPLERELCPFKDLMKKNDELPLYKEGDMIMDLLIELTTKGCGCLLVVNDSNHLVGTFTDSDLRRTHKTNEEEIFKLTVGEMCNSWTKASSPSNITPRPGVPHPELINTTHIFPWDSSMKTGALGP